MILIRIISKENKKLNQNHMIISCLAFAVAIKTDAKTHLWISNTMSTLLLTTVGSITITENDMCITIHFIR